MKKILVVDDNELLCRVARDILETDGYQVVAACDAIRALEAFETESFDAIVTDLRMPGMSGLELARLIRAKNPRFPVIMMTAYGPVQAEEITTCLAKDNLFPELLDAIRLCVSEIEDEAIGSHEGIPAEGVGGL
jgi:CheY-like chemotaxis protein